MANATTAIDTAAMVTTVNDSLVAWEKATANLKAIDENPQLKAIKEATKKARKVHQKAQKQALKAVSSSLKALDVKEACRVCNTLHSTPEGADDVTRQRFSRRRSKLHSIVSDCFTDFEIIKLRDSKTKRVTFSPQWVGSAEHRQAKQIFSLLKKYGEQFASGDLTIESLEESLKADAGEKVVSAPVVPTINTAETVENILAAASLTVAEEKATATVKTRKAANK